MPVPRQIFIAVIGVGGVGRCFLSQLSGLASRLSRSPSAPTHISLVLLARSSKIIYHEDYRTIHLSSWDSELQASSTPMLSLPKMVEYLAAAPKHVVLVDNTSNEDVAACYPSFLENGISIVTPNKKAFSSDISLYNAIVRAASNLSGTGGSVLHESSVGAGLPILSTLHDLIETGDEVHRIEGVFSGTMSFIFNQWNPISTASGGQAVAFSAIVRKARDLGFTEPDPRDDLNGMDVARKLVILARVVGLQKSVEDFPVQSLIPEQLVAAKSADDFLDGLGGFDGEMEKLKHDAAKDGKVVRFVGSLDVQTASLKVGLEKFDRSHPIAALKGSDNIISFYTKRYGDNPLIVQGAGAGGDVTAMGVTADLIKVLRLLPPRKMPR